MTVWVKKHLELLLFPKRKRIMCQLCGGMGLSSLKHSSASTFYSLVLPTPAVGSTSWRRVWGAPESPGMCSQLVLRREQKQLLWRLPLSPKQAPSWFLGLNALYSGMASSEEWLIFPGIMFHLCPASLLEGSSSIWKESQLREVHYDRPSVSPLLSWHAKGSSTSKGGTVPFPQLRPLPFPPWGILKSRFCWPS